MATVTEAGQVCPGAATVPAVPAGRARPRGGRLCMAALAAAALLAAAETAGWYLSRRVGEGPAPDTAEMRRENVGLQRRIMSLAPRGAFLVVDTARNRLSLRKGKTVVREMVVSCGSGNVLTEPGGGRSWVFDTPRGEFKVKTKTRNPVWVKPDWAFIEEGEEVPRDASKRFEFGVLGDYALGFGNGYFIHGTLYRRLLGRNVTHGCVRMGDEDLAEVYRSVPVGSTILIY